MSKTEQRILNWCSNLLLLSVIVMVGIPVLFLGVVAVYNGQFELLAEPKFYLAVLLGLAYITSAYFLFSIEGKGINRRLFSWLQSFIFHYCLFAGVALYLYATNEKLDVLILLTAEVLIGTLSLAGYLTSKKTMGLNHA